MTGAHVNPAVTVAFFTYGRVSLVELITRILGQLTGGCFGWMLLQYILSTHFSLSIGGPATPDGVPTGDAAISEGFATFLLLCAVCLASETALGRNYWIKMSLIAAAVRGIIEAPPVLAATGPAINPMIATTYHTILHGAYPTTRPFFVIYWAGACAGAIVATFLCMGLVGMVATPTPSKSGTAAKNTKAKKA
jgi:glycerol uptake facilitator protein